MPVVVTVPPLIAVVPPASLVKLAALNVLLMVENLKEKSRRQKAEITLHVKGRDIFVEQSHEDLYAAIDQLVDKLDRQVCRHKDRIRDYQHEPARRQAANLM